MPGLTAAACLITDYILTVASGLAAITSANPFADPGRRADRGLRDRRAACEVRYHRGGPTGSHLSVLSAAAAAAAITESSGADHDDDEQDYEHGHLPSVNLLCPRTGVYGLDFLWPVRVSTSPLRVPATLSTAFFAELLA
jgi:hypothetical protein